MKDTLRYRTLGGVMVIWNKTGMSGGDRPYPIGDYECEGCGETLTGSGPSHAEGHAKICRAC